MFNLKCKKRIGDKKMKNINKIRNIFKASITISFISILILSSISTVALKQEKSSINLNNDTDDLDTIIIYDPLSINPDRAYPGQWINFRIGTNLVQQGNRYITMLNITYPDGSIHHRIMHPLPSPIEIQYWVFLGSFYQIGPYSLKAVITEYDPLGMIIDIEYSSGEFDIFARNCE